MKTIRARALALDPNDRKGPAVTLGVRLRHARLVAGYTLLELARKAECSESLISKVERGLATPSLATLHRLAVALDTNIAALTTEDAPNAGPILRAGERPVIKAGGIALERLVLPKRGGLLQANIHIVEPGKASDGQIEHTGEEIGYVLEGTVELQLGDAGAHVTAACDFANTTFALMHWGRDRAHGFSRESLVRRLTGAQAKFFGFADRGEIRLGARADINVIAMDRLTLGTPRLLYDFPGGAKRLHQGASGYVATLVDGVPTVEADELTGALPGQLLRSG